MKLFKTVTIDGSFTAANFVKFTKTINIDFQPDEMIVKMVSVAENDPQNGTGIIHKLNTNMVFPYTIFHYVHNKTVSDLASGATENYSEAHHSTPKLRFKVNGIIQGNYDFWITDINNSIPANIGTYDTDIVITLEFVKYE